MSQPSGFFVINKPEGISSAKAIQIVKKCLTIEKIGHAGTLDPFATGVLVVLVNRATRLASLVTGGQKKYRAIFRFGVSTASDDKTGSVLDLSEVIPNREQIEAVLGEFTGLIQQRPPQVSAVKVAGKRAYKRARANEEFEISLRQVEVTELSIHSYQAPDLELSISCGSGTYIRSLARDIGLRLGSLAMVMTLCREQSAPFSIAESCSPEDCAWESLQGWDCLFKTDARVLVSERQARALAGGDQRVIEEFFSQGLAAQGQLNQRVVFALEVNNASLGLLEYTSEGWRLLGYFGE